jgi:hypothetical protein
LKLLLDQGFDYDGQSKLWSWGRFVTKNLTEPGLVQNLGSRDISQHGPVSYMSDGITGMAVVCEYTSGPVDICTFCQMPSYEKRSTHYSALAKVYFL